MDNKLAIALDLFREQNEVIGVLVKENKLPQEITSILQKTFTVLQEAIAAFQEKITIFEEKNSDLQKTNSKLTQEINKLKEKLGLNSTNSSLPPSSDIYKIKRKNRHLSDRKPGGQPGHPGYSYKPLPPDEIINCFPESCTCGLQLEKTDKFIQKQTIEIPPIKPYVTEYRRWYGHCKACNKTSLAPLPKEVAPDLLGTHTKAIICSLNGFYHNSKRDLQAILSNVFNLDISLGLVADTAKRVNNCLAPHYEALKDKIIQSDYLHIDETGHKSKGKKGWAWVLTNNDTTLLHLDSSRGGKVLKAVLGEHYDGYVISDRYAAYNFFKEEKRQICWSHLLRDFERFANSLHLDLASKGKRLVVITKEVFGLVDKFHTEQISKSELILLLDTLQKELKGILEGILKLPDRPKAQGVAKNLLKSFSMMWRFLEVDGIAMTNNLAERQVRKYVTYRKKLLFTWSDWGNQFVERMLSLYLTCRLGKTNPFLQLTHLITNSH